MVIDAHQHFWKYDPVSHSWIDDSMAVLKRDFLPADLEKVYEKNGVEGCVAVQADQSEDETNFLLRLAAEYDFIKGVVGWVDLRDPKLGDRLDHFATFPKLKGFRHIVQSEPDPAYMLREDFQRGLGMLRAHGFTYDILVFPNQLEAALNTVQQFPLQPFVIDHIAKPYIKRGEIGEWETYMRALGQQPNAWCKISGMVTEADWSSWKYEDFIPYLDIVYEAFGPKRLMFGSDWPVCLLAGQYSQIKELLNRYLTDKPGTSAIWGANAHTFYQL